jgi:hypothetical protein
MSYHTTALFVIQVYSGFNSDLLFWGLLVFKSLLRISQTFLRSILALQLNTVLPIYAPQLLMSSAGTLVHLEQKNGALNIFYYNHGIFQSVR